MPKRMVGNYYYHKDTVKISEPDTAATKICIGLILTAVVFNQLIVVISKTE